jgi:Skp family chaperone for outer membrane proteins
MQYVTLALALIAGIASTIAAALWSADKVKAAAIADLKTQIFAWDAAVKRAKGEFDEGIQRREKIIAELKAEITNLENDLAANRDPSAVRARLGKLLASP